MARRSAIESAETRAAIVQEAVELASIRGLDGVTIGGLSTRLGMSKSGLIGHFGSKQDLQLAALESAIGIFLREVWKPALLEPHGRPRLLALCGAWTAYLGGGAFPGGCFLTTASVEFDARPGRVRSAVVEASAAWIAMLEQEFAHASARGELPREVKAADAAFELNALATGANCTFQLHGDRQTLERAQRAMERVVRGTGSVPG